MMLLRKIYPPFGNECIYLLPQDILQTQLKEERLAKKMHQAEKK